LVCGFYDDYNAFSTFRLTIDFTDEGWGKCFIFYFFLSHSVLLEHRYEAVQVVMQYIEMLNTTEPHRSYFEQRKKLANIAFKFIGKFKPSNFAKKLVSAARVHPPNPFLFFLLFFRNMNQSTCVPIPKYLTILIHP